MPAGRDLVGRAAAILAVLALGVLGILRAESILGGGVPWLAFLCFVASGWGYLVVRAVRVADPDFGLRAAWGLVGLLAVAGPLLAAGVLSRAVVLALVGLGALAFAARELLTPDPMWRVVGRGVQFAKARPGVAVLVGVLVAFGVFRVVAAVAALDRNPWDDDLAYTPFLKRLLEIGDLVEPYSFRRLGSLGGQTVLQALVGARGSIASVHALDHGLCFALAVLAVVGLARTSKTQPLWFALVALALLAMPDTSINTAAHWSGVALFVALYRTALVAAPSTDVRVWALLGVVGAMTCTLRQSYLPPVGLFGLLVVFARAETETWRACWQRVRRPFGALVGAAIVASLGWWIASHVSSQTFLFPLVGGTWNHEISLDPSGLTWAAELRAMLWAAIESTPLAIVPFLFVVLACTSDRRAGRPLVALFVAVSVGFVLLVHAFVGSDVSHLWRYNFGPGIALFVVLLVELGAHSHGDSAVRIPSLGRWLVLAATLLQLFLFRGGTRKDVIAALADLREASKLHHGDPVAAVEQRRYTALQSKLPEGVPVVVMLDDPAYLDYSRNQILNLDTPGYASPDHAMPLLEGAAAMRADLVARGIRHVLFVRSDRSRYFFRRPFWVWRVFNDAELFQVMSAYTIGAIDAFTALATTDRILHDEDGLVAIELAPASPPQPTTRPEWQRRDAFVRAIAEREQLLDAWSLSHRAEVLFEDGFSSLVFLEAEGEDEPKWFETAPVARERSERVPSRALPVRWMQRRSHLRVRARDGARSMHLEIRGKVNLAATHARPRLDITLDGSSLVSVVVDERGFFAASLEVPKALTTGEWQDLYLVWNSVAEPQKDLRDIRVGRLTWVAWEPR